MRVYVTGAGGFVGRSVVAALRERGCDVLSDRINLFDDAAVTGYLESHRPTHLLHLAWVARPCFWTSMENLTWVNASVNLLTRFVDAGGEAFVGAGSCAEYRWDGSVCREDVTPLDPETLYGSSKAGFAQIAAGFCREQACRFAWGRIFFVYGESEPKEKLVRSMIEAARLGGRIEIKDPNRRLDLVHVDDIASGFATLLASRVSGSFNLGTGRGVAIQEIAEAIAASTGADVAVAGEPVGAPAVVADISKMRAVGWEPRVDLFPRLAEMANWKP